MTRLTSAVVAVLALLGVAAAAQRAPAKPKAEAYTVKDVERRVTAALEWLVDHQNIEGYWSATTFDKDSRRLRAARTANLEFNKPGDKTADKGSPDADLSVTALAMLAFAGMGNDHKNGPYKEVLRRAVMYLRKVQTSNGHFGPPEADLALPPAQALCTQALAELFGLSGDNILKGPVEAGVKYILEAQNPGAGWRQGVQPGVSDTQHTAYNLLALKSAKMAGIEFDTADAYAGAHKWLESMTREDKGAFNTGYMQPGGPWGRPRAAVDYENYPIGNAVNVFCSLITRREGFDAKHKVIVAQAKSVTDKPPQWAEKKCDFEYAFWSTHALFQLGDEPFTKWTPAVTRTLLDNQRGFRKEDRDTFEGILAEHGSWDAVDPWASQGGRLWSTAINALTLQCFLRYWRLSAKGLAEGDDKPRPLDPKAPEPTATDIEKRVRGCLEWLLDHQSEDGRFSCSGYSAASKRPRAKKTHNIEFLQVGSDKGDTANNTELEIAGTALGILCFVGAGYGHQEGLYRDEVKRALDWLLAQQGEDGGFSVPSGYDSLIPAGGVAALALAELWSLTKDDGLASPVARATACILGNQTGGGGWRWPNEFESADTQMTGWYILALRSAQIAGIKGDFEKAFGGAAKFFGGVTTDIKGVPSTGYSMAGDGWGRPRNGQGWDTPPIGNAYSVACHYAMQRKGWDAKNKTCAAQVKSLLAKLPEWGSKKCDFEYMFWGTLAMSLVGGADWAKWHKPALKVLMDNQRGFAGKDRDAFEAIVDEHGSWDSLDPWWEVGGRVWSTCTNCLALQIIHRTLKKDKK